MRGTTAHDRGCSQLRRLAPSSMTNGTTSSPFQRCARASTASSITPCAARMSLWLLWPVGDVLASAGVRSAQDQARLVAYVCGSRLSVWWSGAAARLLPL
jgi:hypothetical protein